MRQEQFHSVGTKFNTVQSKHNALPIPLTAIDQSGGALKQNPGH